MIDVQTTLVIGAGASHPYGLPLGGDLRNRLLDIKAESISLVLDEKTGVSRHDDSAFTFSRALLESRLPSIDSFLARRPEYSSVGRNAIAYILLPLENIETALKPDDPSQDWIQYLITKMDAPWDEIENNRISFVTFNYDRLLEFSLATAFAALHGKTFHEGVKLVDKLNIVHMYGSLGSLDEGRQGHMQFGGINDNKFASQICASKIKIISDDRSDSPEVRVAQAYIEESDALCFLGFGFDETNISRLGGKSILRPSHRSKVQGKPWQKLLAASSLGMTKHETWKAFAQISGMNTAPPPEDIFFPTHCLDLLRLTQILG